MKTLLFLTILIFLKNDVYYMRGEEMKAVFFVLNNAELLTPLLSALSKRNISGGTIFDSNGMARELAKNEDFQLVGILRALLNPNLKSTKTLFFIMEAERIKILEEAIEEVVGDLSKPNSGILFSIPLDYVKGLKF